MVEIGVDYYSSIGLPKCEPSSHRIPFKLNLVVEPKLLKLSYVRPKKVCGMVEDALLAIQVRMLGKYGLTHL